MIMIAAKPGRKTPKPRYSTPPLLAAYKALLAGTVQKLAPKVVDYPTPLAKAFAACTYDPEAIRVLKRHSNPVLQENFRGTGDKNPDYGPVMMHALIDYIGQTHEGLAAHIAGRRALPYSELAALADTTYICFEQNIRGVALGISANLDARAPEQVNFLACSHDAAAALRQIYFHVLPEFSRYPIKFAEAAGMKKAEWLAVREGIRAEARAMHYPGGCAFIDIPFAPWRPAPSQRIPGLFAALDHPVAA